MQLSRQPSEPLYLELAQVLRGELRHYRIGDFLPGEMQLARRNNCSPFLLQVPWGKHNPVDWRGQHAAQGLEGVDVDGVLPVVVVKDPFTWMRSMCRMDLCGNVFSSNSDTTSERYTRPSGASGTSRNPRHASH